MSTEKEFFNGVFIREKTFNDGGSLLNVVLTKSGLAELSKRLNAKDEVHLTFSRYRDDGKDRKGITHYAIFNNYTPTDKPQPEKETESNEDLPF